MTTHRRLNWINFSLADVGGSIGPFLASYLVGTSHWKEASVGLLLLILNIATVVAQAPAGFVIDRMRHKRVLVACASMTVAVCMLVPLMTKQKQPILLSCILIGIATAIIPSAIAAITLGIVGPSRFTRQTGSNQAYNHTGNLFATVVIGACSYFIVDWALFPTISILAICSAVLIMKIPKHTIHHDVARGGMSLPMQHSQAPSFGQAISIIVKNRPLMIFILCAALFHLANAPMLPLAGQKLALAQPKLATVYMASCVLVAQTVMIGIAILIGARAEQWGRKRFLLLGFVVLPLRGLWFSQVSDPYLIIAGQILDGIGAGVYGAIIFLVVADPHP